MGSHETSVQWVVGVMSNGSVGWCGYRDIPVILYNTIPVIHSHETSVQWVVLVMSNEAGGVCGYRDIPHDHAGSLWTKMNTKQLLTQ